MNKKARKLAKGSKNNMSRQQPRTRQQSKKLPETDTQRESSSAAGRHAETVKQQMKQPISHKQAAKEMARQAILGAIGDCAGRLGQVPSQTQLTKMSGYTKLQIRRHFGSYAAALRECKLEKGGGGWKVSLDKLFSDWAMVVRALKKVPTMSEYAQFSEYSHTPLLTRFGTWSQVPHGLKQYADEQGMTEWNDVLEMIVRQERTNEEGQGHQQKWHGVNEGFISQGRMGRPTGEIKFGKVLPDRPVYGALMRPYPLIHAPTNEDGVLVLFGALAERLGFMIERVQQGFPDCEAMRLVGPDRCQRVRIEFEYDSRNFLKHMHEASKCDIIVCWVNNWPECPLEVIELRKFVNG